MGIRETISALLLDFDGTIADTTRAWVHATRACFAARGLELDDMQISRLLESPWCDAVPGLSEPELRAIESDIVGSIREEYLECPPAPGLDAFLSSFAEVPKAIVTSSYRGRLVTPYLRRHGLEQHFAVVIGCEDTDRLKPDPQPILLALRLLGASGSGAWMIGDSRADTEAAAAARIGSIGLANPAAGGDHFADSVHALGRLVRALAAEDKYCPE